MTKNQVIKTMHSYKKIEKSKRTKQMPTIS